MTMRIMVVVLLTMTAASHAAVMDYYFYPSGPKPPGIPPDSATVQGVALATWEDAAVDANASATAFGADEWAHVESAYLGRPDANLLVKLANAYDTLSGQVVSATLHLYVFGAGSAVPSVALDAARVTSGWTEGTVTWNTKPTLGTTTEGYNGMPTMNNTVTVDVTAPVAAEQLDGAGNRYGIGLTDTAGSSPYVVTKESQTAAYRPFLHIGILPEPSVPILILLLIVRRIDR